MEKCFKILNHVGVEVYIETVARKFKTRSGNIILVMIFSSFMTMKYLG